MCRLPSEQSIRDMLSTSFPQDVTVTKVKPFLSLRPQRIYQVDLSDNTTLHLVLPPLSMWRPLRSEQAIVSTEATAVDWLQQVLTRHSSSSSPCSSRSSRRGSRETSKQQDQDSETLLRLLPCLVQHGRDTTTALREFFAFYEPSRGTALTLLDPKIPDDPNSPERQQVDLELGTFYRRLLTHPGLVSPTGRFGPLAAVIPLLQPSQPQRSQPGAGGLFGTSGAGTWSVAFHSMLEGVLRDGEDMAVVLGYSTIRRHFRRLGYLLDDVTVPKLVVVDAAQDSNLLVERNPERDGGEETRITGLQSWANCVFGDPLFAMVFSDPPDLPPPPPSSSFLRAFNSTSSPSATAATSDYISTLNPQIIESTSSAPVRLLFYQIYHILTRIVAEFYRPRPDSTARELEARRKLNVVLARLAEVPDDFLAPPDYHYSASLASTPNNNNNNNNNTSTTKSLSNKREHGVARPSGEMSPAKRLRELELPIPKK